MAKVKAKKKVYEPVVEQVSGNVAIIRMVEKQYKMVPVDMDTHADLMELCAMRGLGRRGQGAMVRILVKAEKEKIQSEVSKLK